MTPVRAMVPDYAGHADANARRLSDQQLRAWVGVGLTALRDRLPVAGTLSAFEDLLFHCEFGDQRVIKALEDPRLGEPPNAALIEGQDGAVIAAVAGIETVDADGLPAFIANVTAAFRRRNEAIVALKG